MSEKPTLGMICQNCHWFDSSNGISGRCRRHAPAVVRTHDINDVPVWPVVAHDDWCGEFVA